MAEFKENDWVILNNKHLGRITKIINRADAITKEIFCFYVETFKGCYWCSKLDIKKIDTKKLERLIQECIVDE